MYRVSFRIKQNIRSSSSSHSALSATLALHTTPRRRIPQQNNSLNAHLNDRLRCGDSSCALITPHPGLIATTVVHTDTSIGIGKYAVVVIMADVANPAPRLVGKEDFRVGDLAFRFDDDPRTVSTNGSADRLSPMLALLAFAVEACHIAVLHDVSVLIVGSALAADPACFWVRQRAGL
jgi:hypothetical protein